MIERLYEDREKLDRDYPRESSQNIELSDREHSEKLQALYPTGHFVKFNTELVYRPPNDEEIAPEFKEKWELAKKITKETKTIKLNEGKKNAKSKGKTAKGKPKKNHTKPNPAAVAQV